MSHERRALVDKDAAQSEAIPRGESLYPSPVCSPPSRQCRAYTAAAPWAAARPSLRDPSRRLPQAIAHRGAKAYFPENTMAAFRGAVGAGSHAIETDVHLSADGVAVLSHVTNQSCLAPPPNLKRLTCARM